METHATPRSRAIPLPENVDPDQIKATFTNGVLEVTTPAPKAEQRAPKKIEVK
jgi:HSP20 family protein